MKIYPLKDKTNVGLIMQSFEHSYKGVGIKIAIGDITKLKVDAIVNPANSSMSMGGGVAGAIKRAGGTEIEAEALSKAPVRVGEAITTKAGKLSAKFVIHTPTMTSSAMRIDEGNAQRAMHAALECIQDLKVDSVAFPGLGTGVGGLSMETAARIMMQELKEYLDKSATLKEVIFVGYVGEAAIEFEKAFVETFKRVG